MPRTGAGHKFTLGLDLDGVTGDYEAQLREFAARTTGRSLSTYPQAASWDMVACGWFDSQQQFLDTHAAAVNDGMFARMKAMNGASKALHELSDEGVRIRVITHRLLLSGAHRRVVSDTVAFLDDADIPYSDLCFVTDKTTVGCDVLLDDAPHNITAARAAGVPTIAFDQLYNRELPGPRAMDWADAKRQIHEFFDDWKNEVERIPALAQREPRFVPIGSQVSSR